MIEEDELLCKHQWVDLYNGSGIDKNDPNIALSTFFCKFCLQIKVKSYDQSRFHMSKEYLEQYYEDRDDGEKVAHG